MISFEETRDLIREYNRANAALWAAFLVDNAEGAAVQDAPPTLLDRQFVFHHIVTENDLLWEVQLPDDKNGQKAFRGFTPQEAFKAAIRDVRNRAAALLMAEKNR